MLSRRNFLQYGTYGAAALFLAQHCTTTATLTTPSTGTSTAMAPQGERPLRVGFIGIPHHLNPALYSVLEEHQLGLAIFDSLVWVDETLTPQPLLAKSWELSADLLHWTFTLQENVFFHHGTPFTAADVVATFQHLMNSRTGSTFRAVLHFVEHVKALDDYTVRFDLTTANAELPLLLGSPYASIIPHDEDLRHLNVHPLGTGPFRLEEYIPREQAKLVRNQDYWGTSDPYVEYLEYYYDMDYASQLTALHDRKLDVIAQVNATDIATLRADPNVNVRVAQSGNHHTIIMQANHPPFSDVRVRQAFKYCANNALLHQQVLGGHGVTANHTPVATISPYWAEFPQYTQDFAKARELLAQAGYTHGLKLDLITAASRPGMVELAQAFSAMVAPAGIKIEVIRVPTDVYWTDYWHRAPFHVGDWGFRPSIDETFTDAYHSSASNNESRWRNLAFDALIEQARAEHDEETRKELYTQAQQLLWDEGAVIIPYFYPVAIALNHDLDQFILHPAGWLDFSTVRWKS